MGGRHRLRRPPDVVPSARIAGVGAWLAPLLALAIVLAAAGCEDASRATGAGRWSLALINGIAPTVPGSLELTGEQISIRTGCNSGGGTYRVEGGRLLPLQTSMTAMGCAGPAGTQETVFLRVLGGPPLMTVLGDRLRLETGSESLAFVRAP